jgi:uncharacterized protein
VARTFVALIGGGERPRLAKRRKRRSRLSRILLCLGGHAFFVVGVHPQSSRLARRFPFTGIVFNVFDQFEQLEREGRYARTSALSRKRDRALQGSANPMVVAHGDKWEGIQFSGKSNPETWKCPFRFVATADKPINK